jgi:spermidine synthase
LERQIEGDVVADTQNGHGREPRLRFASAYAFVGSGCLLVLELVAGRILAPTIGVSLYTWTSIIGVVLAGISIGNYLGGRLADRRPGRATLSSLYLFSALASSLVLAFSRDLSKVAAPHTWPAVLQVLWLTILLFFLPSMLLGTMTPMLIKLSLRSLDATGRVVGRVQAAATLGSIIGTFITGFFLISWFGTRAIVAGVSGALLVLAILSNPIWTKRKVVDVAVVAFFIAGLGLLSKTPCVEESNYFCIQVSKAEGRDVLILTLDHLDHGFVDMHDPTNLLYPYESLYASVLTATYPEGAPVDSFLIGGGAYTMPRYMAKHYSGTVLVAEIDPAVTKVAHNYLFLPRTTPIRTINDDARRVLIDLPASERFDIALEDAFNDAAVPYHLTTLEFNRVIDRHLNPDGIYMANIIDGVRYSFLRSYLRTLTDTFEHVRLMAVEGAWPVTGQNRTFVVVASHRPLPEVSEMVPAAESRAFVAEGPSVLLTDDHVPVDQLLAPNFRQRFER